MSYTKCTILLALVSIVQCRPSTVVLDQNPSGTNERSKREVDADVQMQAYEYYIKLHQEYQCALPQLRVIPVQKIHPTNAVTYTTGSVLLHRCAEDTGCCPPKKVCMANETETITIPILVHKLGHDEEPPQKLQFVNHTKCECVDEKTLATA